MQHKATINTALRNPATATMTYVMTSKSTILECSVFTSRIVAAVESSAEMLSTAEIVPGTAPSNFAMSQ